MTTPHADSGLTVDRGPRSIRRGPEATPAPRYNAALLRELAGILLFLAGVVGVVVVAFLVDPLAGWALLSAAAAAAGFFLSTEGR